MGKHAREVKQKLGDDVAEWILADVTAHVITGQNMKDIAFELDKDIGGKHMWRLEHQSSPQNPASEMMTILGRLVGFGYSPRHVDKRGSTKACGHTAQFKHRPEAFGKENRAEDREKQHDCERPPWFRT